MKLYKHTTDGGAEYLCTDPIQGANEGDLSTAVVRLDGQPETCGRFDAFPELLDLVRKAYERFTDNDMQPANHLLAYWLHKAEEFIAIGTK